MSNNKLVYMSHEVKSKHMVNNIYNIMQNIEKLNDGKIKKYMISSQLELEVLCDYFKSNNILHKIKIESLKHKTRCFLYDEFKKEINLNKGSYFNRNSSDYERNKIIKLYKLYIEVYKGFENLFDRKYLYYNSDIKSDIVKPKFGIYLYGRSFAVKQAGL